MKKCLILLIFQLIIVIIGILIVPYEYLQRIVVYIGAFFVFFAVLVIPVLKNKYGRRIVMKIRGFLYIVFNRWKGTKNLVVDENVRFHNSDKITIGRNVSIDRGAEFFPLGRGYPSKIVIGNNVHIGAYNRFASMNEVIIEDDVLFAAYVHVTDHSHEFVEVKLPIHMQGVRTKGPVKIEKGAWLGFRCNILSGVTIGKNSVVAAGAVVTSDVPPYSVVAGVPARVIKRYDFEKEEWVGV